MANKYGTRYFFNKGNLAGNKYGQTSKHAAFKTLIKKSWPNWAQTAYKRGYENAKSN